MNRRSFFATGTAAALASAISAPVLSAKSTGLSPALRKALYPKALSIEAGLEPYSPSATNPWNERTAGHLLRRTGFQALRSDITYALARTPQETVDVLLEALPGDYPSEYNAADTELWGMKPAWYIEDRKRYTTQEELQQYQMLLRTRIVELQQWWLERMYRSTLQRSGSHTVNPLMEKMTLFWHNHFTSDWQKVNFPQLLFIQNNTLREDAFGNFKSLARKMVSDPAMLAYLDGATNTRLKPNENFARELLELFTLGEGTYTEHDVLEAARVVTGWLLTEKYPFVTFDNPLLRLHDYDAKTVLGTLIKPDPAKPKVEAGKQEADQLIDVIFAHTFARNEAEQQAGKARTEVEVFKGKSVAAVFLATKLYKSFVYEIIDVNIVAQLADQLVQNNFEVKPVLRTLLGSAHFFDAQLHGACIKSPLDHLVGILRQYAVALPANDNPNRPFMRTVLESTALLGQEVLAPPNVAGWPGYHHWINTTTYPMRNVMGDALLFGKDASGRPMRTQIDVQKFGSWFPSLANAETFVADAVSYLLSMDISAGQKADLVAELLQGAPTYEWTEIVMTDPEQTKLRLQLFLRAAMRLPEFQLT